MITASPFTTTRPRDAARGAARARQRLGTSVLVLCLCALRPAAAQYTEFRRDARHILEGTWQSCRQDDGSYSERVYDHLVNGVGRFEVHLGPRNEFAIFPGVQDEHRAHDAPENLLQPYRVPTVNGRAARTWAVPSLGVTFTVTLGGGSFTDCEHWYILLGPSAAHSQ